MWFFATSRSYRLSYEHKALVVLTREKMRLISCYIFCHLPICSQLLPLHFALSFFDFVECFSPPPFHVPAWCLAGTRTLLSLFRESEVLICSSSYSFMSCDQWCFSQSHESWMLFLYQKKENSFTFQTPSSILQKHVGGEEFENTVKTLPMPSTGIITKM